MPAYKCKQTGKWMARFYYATHDGQRKQKKKRGFDLKRDAEEYERDFLSRLEGQPFIPFSAFCDEYLKDSEKRTKRTTHAAKVSAVEKHFKPYFKDKPLNEITPSDIRGWQNNQIAIKAAPSSIAIRSGVLSSIFSHAVKFHNLKQNPVIIAGGAGSLKKKRINFWTLDQFNRFIEVVDDVFYKAVFTTFFYTGLRFGELMGLTLNSFNFESKTLQINKILNQFGEITTPKTEKSNRVIYLSNINIAAVKDYLNALHKPKPDELIFDKVSRPTIVKRLRTYTKTAQLPAITIHDLRHSHASLLIHNDVSPLIIQERLGHENVQTTLETYSHLYPDRQKEVADLLNDLSPN